MVEVHATRVTASGPPPEGGSSRLRLGLLGMEWFSARPSGLNRYVAELRQGLEDNGVEIQAVVTGPVSEVPPGVTVAGRVSDPVSWRLFRYWRGACRVAGSVDLADAHLAIYALLPTHLGPLARRPLVVHFHGPWADESQVERNLNSASHLIRHFIERRVYRRAAELVTLSAAFRSVLVESYGVAPWQVHVIAPAIDLEAFTPYGRDAARRALGLTDEVRVVLAVRRLVPRMGLADLLEAWARLPRTDIGTVLVIAGEGGLQQRLEDHARRLGIEDQVRFLGRVDETSLTSWYRAADVCVVPSASLEGFGLAALEALASGTPPVVTDVGGLPELVSGLDPSLIVPARDPAALSARLEEALAGNVPGRRACRRHAETFSRDRAVRSHLVAYRRALDPKPVRDIRVVYVDHTAQLSGGELALLRLLPALRGVQAHVVLAENGPLVDRLLREGLSVEVLEMERSARQLSRRQVRPIALPTRALLGSTTYVARLALRLRRLKPDVVHTNSLKAAVYGGLAARIAGVPCIWHIRDRISSDYLPGGAARMIRFMARALPCEVIANSSTTLSTLRLPASRGRVIPSPLHSPRVVRVRSNSETLRVGMVGRIASWKGQDVFLSAFARAFPRGLEQAVIVGSALFPDDQEFAARLFRLAHELGIGPRVEFVGFTEDVAAELSRLHILVHASILPEPFGQVVAEGMGAGLPVVAAAAGGPAELIEDGVSGLLYPPGDVRSLAVLLGNLAKSPELRERLGEAGRAVVERLSPQRLAPQVVDVYRGILCLSPDAQLSGR